MGRIDIKPNRTSEQCVCGGHNAKHKLMVKGIHSSPQSEILLCNPCFEELKEKINNSD